MDLRFTIKQNTENVEITMLSIQSIHRSMVLIQAEMNSLELMAALNIQKLLLKELLTIQLQAAAL